MQQQTILQAALCSMMLISPPALRAADLAVIDQSGQYNEGALSVNQAAGNLNQQANIRAIANNPDGQASAQVSASLINHNRSSAAPDQASAMITGDSFSHNTGVVGVNQIAGSQNSTANMVGIAYGGSGTVAAASDALLAGTRAPSGSAEPVSPINYQASISDQAFQGTKGVVQVNQVAGALNQAVNTLTVSFVRPEGN